MKPATLRQLLADRAAKRPVALATDLASGEERLLHRDTPTGDPPLDAAAARVFRDDTSMAVELGPRRLFLHVFNPPLRLIVVGAVHIAQPLSRMAAMTGYDVTVVDPRGAFATADRFPGVSLSAEWPDDAMAALMPDARSAVVTLTHDPKLDDPALDAALKSQAFYLGALGSRKTHAARLERLRRLGHDDNSLARIRGPVGLKIGAKSPAEVAISILGQMTETLRGAGASAASGAAA
jgi:xanthine dehydrogenase accessory factor